MHFIIQMVLLVAICMAGFPGLFANPAVENEEQAIMMRSEENQKWGCVLWGAYCWGKSADFSPACHECMSNCDATTCAKKPEPNQSATPECQKCVVDCRKNVCNK